MTESLVRIMPARRPIGTLTTLGSDPALATVLVLPFLVIFALFVVYPIGYGIWASADLENYRRLWRDPLFFQTIWNTLLFLIIAVNLKLFLALLLSGLFLHPQRWIRWLNVIFILPWAIPSLVSILSFRWMLNVEFGMINNVIFRLTGDFGLPWLIDPSLAFGGVIVVHIWKNLPFWTLILLAGRMAIPRDLYESAEVDGAGRFQSFRHITWPSVRNLYVTSTLLSTLTTLGDFNSVYLLTGGGPNDTTHVLATLGIRYAFGLGQIDVGIATIVAALPFVIPLAIYLISRMRRTERE